MLSVDDIDCTKNRARPFAPVDTTAVPTLCLHALIPKKFSSAKIWPGFSTNPPDLGVFSAAYPFTFVLPYRQFKTVVFCAQTLRNQLFAGKSSSLQTPLGPKYRKPAGVTCPGKMPLTKPH